MTKFILDNTSVFSIGGNALTCITEVNFDESADTYFSQCAAASGSVRFPVIGTGQVTGSITIELDHNDTTELGYIDIGDSGALLFYPQGNTATYLKISATTMTITGRNMRYSSTGLAMGTANFALDSLTIAAATGS